MTYVQGFLIPVPTEKKVAYLKMAQDTAPLFHEFGASRIVETWGVDVPDGETTDMKRAVQAKPDESIVFSWIEWPDKVACDAGAKKMMSDERMKMPDDMPFDPARMIVAGFEPIVTQGGGPFGYVDGVVVPVAKDDKDAYLRFADATSGVFTRHGMVGSVDAWGEDIADGKVTDFKKAVAASEDEAVVFGWVAWPDKATRDKAWEGMMQDPEMQGSSMPFDGKRMIFGGFETLLDTQGEVA